ncbi:MAG: DUF2278 family protein [Cyanobacteriota bacterium]|nr:DUF2278 family protein [Cyanobacteriota bacterium]
MKNYGVLKGSAIAYKRDNDQDPHSELLMSVDGESFRVAINVRSSRGPVKKRLVEYLVVQDLNHPLVERVRVLPEGWNPMTGAPADAAAIDYIRSNLFRPKDLKPLVHTKPGPNNDLFELVEDLLQRAIEDEEAMVYAFGERWGPEDGKKDQYFQFKPGNGVHLIHMNQGGSGDQGGRYRDGALFVDFPSSGITHALFLKFQNQVWHTGGERALPVAGAPAIPELAIPETGPIHPWAIVPADSPTHLAAIISAMVNPVGSDRGHESVTILNTSASPLDLEGWSLLDERERRQRLSGTLLPSETLTIHLDGNSLQLNNKGGTITLLNAQSLKVDGVAYTAAQAQVEGLPVVFN